jgi:uncharacterized protein (TIGR00255 family)
MIRSMTAFSRREGPGGTGTLTWEVRSINHRYLEISVRTPEEFRAIENKVREVVGKHLSRGKVDCTLRYQPEADVAHDIPLNEDVARRVVQACTRVQALASNTAPLNPFDVLRWPGVLNAAQADQPALHEAALALLGAALADLSAGRRTEGGKLQSFIDERCAAMRAIVAAANTRLPEIALRIREKLTKRLEELRAEVDANRLEQELVFLAQKMDVAEEMGRLLMHLDEVEKLIKQKEPVGRRLDFLMQELHREANTLGSKSADIETTRASVDLKVLIEQIREQVQNIE